MNTKKTVSREGSQGTEGAAGGGKRGRDVRDTVCAPQDVSPPEEGRLFVAGVVLLALLGVGAGGWLWWSQRAEDAAKRAAQAENAMSANVTAAAKDKKTAKGGTGHDPASKDDARAAVSASDVETPPPQAPQTAGGREGRAMSAATRRAAERAAAPPPSGTRRISGERLEVTPESELSKEPWKLREEKFRLGESLRNLGDEARAGAPLPAELVFPTFDGGSLTFTDFEFRPQSLANEGVFFAKVKGETQGGHVLLSYVNNALVGSIHSPGLGVFLEIRNATPQGASISDIFLTQLDPSKMPTCGTCDPKGGTFNPARPPQVPKAPATPRTPDSGG